MKPKGRFERVSDIQRKSQVVLDSIKENDFQGALEAWKERQDRFVSSQEITLKDMAAKIE
jgi:hypothetical protein